MSADDRLCLVSSMERAAEARGEECCICRKPIGDDEESITVSSSPWSPAAHEDCAYREIPDYRRFVDEMGTKGG